MPGRATTSIARRLGGPAARRRRHRRVALALALLAVIAGVLVVAGGSDDDDRGGQPVATGGEPIARVCQLSNTEIATAQRALLRDNDAPGAVEGFLGDAFVDLSRDRSAAIRAVDPPPAPEVLAVLDDFDAVVDAIEDDPAIGVGTDPFVDVDARWEELGLPDCAMGAGTVEPE